MKQILIKGDFTLEGDIPGLDKICKNFKVAKIEIGDCHPIRMMEFLGYVKENKK